MNSNSEKSSATGGIGFCGALTITFIVLKLIGKIDWSWGWVLSPLWIGLVLWAVIVLIMIIIYKTISRYH